MASHSARAETSPTKVTLGGIEFDRVVYDREGDVLYLHVGDPSTAVDYDGTPEGHATRYGPDGSLVGVTIVNARWLLEHEGKIVLTLPKQRIEATDLGNVLR
jgi:uncharacterized protein YuzE